MSSSRELLKRASESIVRDSRELWRRKRFLELERRIV